MNTNIYKNRVNFIGTCFLLAVTSISISACKYKSSSKSNGGILSVSNFNIDDPNMIKFFTNAPVVNNKRQVTLLHLDGYRADVFKKMVESGYLPHFEFLLKRAKVSFTTSTVDKSETMKVIQSYLTSKKDTSVVGWWQFDRSKYQFRNFWLDPVEIVNYAVGSEFPLAPTALDYLSAQNKNVLSGFALHRRGVPFWNYNRAYVEGLGAVTSYEYFAQAQATTNGYLKNLKNTQIGGDAKSRTYLSHVLLATADEIAHLKGVQWKSRDIGKPQNEYCLDREDTNHKKFEPIFKMIEENGSTLFNGFLMRSGKVADNRTIDGKLRGYFSKLEMNKTLITNETGTYKNLTKLCVPIEMLSFEAEPDLASPATWNRKDNYIHPWYALSMLFLDMELGRIIDTSRKLQYDTNDKIVFKNVAPGLLNYIKNNKLENSQFENTLYVMFGDHGMVETRHFTTRPNSDPDRDPISIQQTFVEYLNESFGIETPSTDINYVPKGLIGIDDKQLPARLAFPHKFKDWQTGVIATKEFGPIGIRDFTSKADIWAREFITFVKNLVKGSLHEKYWYLFFFKEIIIDPKFDKAIEPRESMILDAITQTYLRGEPEYVKAETNYKQKYMSDNISYVYGGGALNNAEIFLPTREGAKFVWNKRPSYDEILSYKAVHKSPPMVKLLQTIPPVGLIFIRQENASISPQSPLPNPMHITVLDKKGGEGLITVKSVPTNTGEQELIYRYDVKAGTRDPLQYIDSGIPNGFSGTYNEWNDITIEKVTYYPNTVSGIGSYLYSNNSSIGDILLMHAQNWNFGENGGGHGGLDWGEKITFSAISGPEIQPGILMGHPKYHSNSGTSVVPASEGDLTHPTLLDMVPSALSWLGEGDKALTKFSRGEFINYYRKWNVNQNEDLSLGGTLYFKELGKLMDLEFETTPLYPKLKRLFQFMPLEVPQLPDFSKQQEDGNILNYQ